MDLLRTRTDTMDAWGDLELEGAEAGGGVVAGGGGGVVAGCVSVASLVRGDHHAAVRRQPLHPLLHAAVAVGAPEVAPACQCPKCL